ncbi:MAG TPA: alpha/beta hydrolase [Terracidiphilus sp.]|nr:alpha/beta hydrolase [Terracidiphilus sp.]
MDFQRHTFHHDGLTLSYLDTGSSPSSGTRPPLLALHAHLMQGSTYAALAAILAPDYRVIAPDQRGHGDSSHAATYTREDYLGDIEALLTLLDLPQAVLLGNSLGGVNAYQFAARHPERVKALIIEDIGAVVTDDIGFVLPWRGVFSTREQLEVRVGARFVPYLSDSFRRSDHGWHLAFDPQDMVRSQQNTVGDHWADWLASDCPTLILRGCESHVTSQEHMEQMAERRPDTHLLILDGGHALHTDNPGAFNSVVRSFLDSL